jgi:hypothetical protein
LGLFFAAAMLTSDCGIDTLIFRLIFAEGKANRMPSWWMAEGEIMAEEAHKQGWVYLFVCEPGPGETFLGLADEKDQLRLIPAFRSREDANDCFLSLPREKGKKYELQAIHIEELEETATANGFTVTLVDGQGQLIKD